MTDTRLSRVWMEQIVAEVIVRLERKRRCSAQGAGYANVLRREGDTWLIVYAGTDVRLRDAKGLRDLSALLARPMTEIHVADLIAAAERRAEDARLSVDRSQAGGAALDPRARQEFGRRLGDLQEEMAEADRCRDRERAARCQQEFEALSSTLARSYGLGGRARPLSNPAERMRKTVAARIRFVIARLQPLHPPLGGHLEAAVRTGTFCSYVPSQPTDWIVEG
jgi:hypothetical protein